MRDVWFFCIHKLLGTGYATERDKKNSISSSRRNLENKMFICLCIEKFLMEIISVVKINRKNFCLYSVYTTEDFRTFYLIIMALSHASFQVLHAKETKNWIHTIKSHSFQIYCINHQTFTPSFIWGNYDIVDRGDCYVKQLVGI